MVRNLEDTKLKRGMEWSGEELFDGPLKMCPQHENIISLMNANPKAIAATNSLG